MNTPDYAVHQFDEGAASSQQPRQAPPVPPYAPDERSRKAAYYAEDPRRKSPSLAMILSLMPGLGQIYIGYYQQGFTNILIVAGTIALLANSGEMGLSMLEPPLGIFLAFYWLYNLVDAGRRASFYNHALSGLEKMELPQDIRMPSSAGSLAGGVALVVVGLIFFSNTMFGWSLRWVEQWWPFAIVLGGAYLIYRSIQDRREKQNAPGPGDSTAA